MICPNCGSETYVVDSRPDEAFIKRRRGCVSCKYRFNTVEIDMDLYETLVRMKEKENQE